MANIFRVYKDSQVTADRIRAENAYESIVTPARRLYVFGGATNLFPYFTTFANAHTYALALTPAPSTTNPVSIVLLSDGDGEPVEITGPDDWYALCLAGIYVSSPYRDVFSTTTLPTTLPKGMRVMYVDGNGVETLWVGNADGNAWPAVGYKEYTVLVSYSAPTITVTTRKNDLGNVVWTRSGTGSFVGTLSGAFANNDWGGGFYYETRQITAQDGENQYILYLAGSNSMSFANFIDDSPSDLSVTQIPVSIRIYP